MSFQMDIGQVENKSSGGMPPLSLCTVSVILHFLSPRWNGYTTVIQSGKTTLNFVIKMFTSKVTEVNYLLYLAVSLAELTNWIFITMT